MNFQPELADALSVTLVPGRYLPPPVSDEAASAGSPFSVSLKDSWICPGSAGLAGLKSSSCAQTAVPHSSISSKDRYLIRFIGFGLYLMIIF